MGVLDDLEAALAAFEAASALDPGACQTTWDDIADLVTDHGPALLAVCRAAVAYRKARRSGDYDAIAETKQALLAATEGL